MPNPAVKRRRNNPGTPPRTIPGARRWKLEDAKARLSEMVRLAGTAGPQLVTVRGKEAAVVLAPEQYRRLLPRSRGQQSLVSFLRGLGLSALDLERESDRGRDLAL